MKIVRCLFFLAYVFKAQSNSFTLDFQSNGGHSVDEWAEYLPKFPLMKEFTSCFWEKLRFFATDYTAVWGYCKQKSSTDQSIKCTQFYHRGTPSTGNRHINIYGWIDGKTEITVKIPNYRHQTWNHFCWKYSSISGNNTFYYNGEVVGVVKVKETPLIGSDDHLPNALIIGQEQDAVKGRYELSQMLNGKLSEFHIWNHSLDLETISSIASCKTIIKGNVVDWKREHFYVQNAILREVEDPSMFCEQDTTYLFFPQLETLSNAKTLCAAYGGRIATPRTSEENNEIMRILQQHGNQCLDMKSPRQKGRAIWLGFVRTRGKWFISDDDMLLGEAPYGHWDKFTPVYPNLGCTFYQTDGYWSFRDKTSCEEMELCTICVLERTPVFSLKGPLCQLFTPLDWNFYISTNETNQIDGFIGYKVSKISYRYSTWSLTDEGVQISLSDYSHPIGRKPWTWYNRRCGEFKPEERILTLSKCEYGTEFTCKSGRCISLYKRCDTNNDCKDGSDEENCTLIRIPDNYDKVYQPNVNGNDLTKIWTQITIQNIDKIDSVDMLVGVTLRINMRWKDSRLTFANLDRNNKNHVSEEVSNQLWTPLDNVVYSNAVIGKIFQDRIKQIYINPISKAMPLSGYEIYEDELYSGEENTLEASQLLRLEYNCVFAVERFPFDEHNCPFILKMTLDQNNSMILVQDNPSVIYNGENIMDQYSIGEINAKDSINGSDSTFVITIHMKRIYNDQLINTFIPTILLWLLSYSTLFIKLDDFNDRFIGTVTALLVMTSLLGSINMTLPRTSYFKFIDLWFLWYIANIFSIITFHIIVDYDWKNKRFDISDQILGNRVRKVLPIKVRVGGKKVMRHLDTLSGAFDEMFKKPMMLERNDKNEKEQTKSSKEYLNHQAIRFFPIINIIFILIYAILTTTQNTHTCHTQNN